MGSLACVMAQLLSQYKPTGFDILGITPNAIMNFLIQIVSLATSEAAMYLDSVVELTMVSCFELF